MYPYLELKGWMFPPVTVSSYRLFFWLACGAVITLSILGIYKRHLPRAKSVLVLLAMAMSVPAGARILHILTNPVLYQHDPAKMWSWHLTGFSLMGGLLLAAVTGITFSRLLRIDPWPLADTIAPGLGVGLILMRTGCFLNGCCFGKKTAMPWAVHFPGGSIPYNYYLSEVMDKKGAFPWALFCSPGLHPTQVYEGLAVLGITLAVLYLIRKRAPTGVPFLTFALLFALFRWCNTGFRVPAATLHIAASFYPFLYGGIIVLCILLILHRCSVRRVSDHHSPVC